MVSDFQWIPFSDSFVIYKETQIGWGGTGISNNRYGFLASPWKNRLVICVVNVVIGQSRRCTVLTVALHRVLKWL